MGKKNKKIEEKITPYKCHAGKIGKKKKKKTTQQRISVPQPKALSSKNQKGAERRGGAGELKKKNPKVIPTILKIKGTQEKKKKKTTNGETTKSGRHLSGKGETKQEKTAPKGDKVKKKEKNTKYI